MQNNGEITYAYLETTNFCNLDCVYCNRREVVTEPKHMSLDRWDMVLDKLSSQPITEAKLMGLGEPFLHPHFHEVCKRFKGVFPSAFTITATNCQFKINEKFIEVLSYIDLLYLSIDGFEDSFEEARAGATWSKALEFLDDIADISAGKTRIAINYVVTDKNFRDIVKLNEMVSDRYGYIEEVRLNVAQWWREDDEIDFELSDELYSTLIDYRENVKGKSPWTFSDCFWPKTGFYMDVNGDVRICCLNTSTKPIGNIFESELKEIVRAPKRERVAKQCSMDQPGSHCRSCDYKRLSPILERVFMERGRKSL